MIFELLSIEHSKFHPLRLFPEIRDKPFFNNLACKSIYQIDVALLCITYINKADGAYIYKCDVCLYSSFDYFLSLVGFLSD
ncbi:hypothetical protein CWO27_15225 [Vibrio sp. 10N.286.51.C3]|nr:hypothetical protein CWO27_15225 [Vibrio sp. 10N.286.51.C3]